MVHKARHAGKPIDKALYDKAKEFYEEAFYRSLFIGAENSMGFHNPTEAMRVLGDSVAFAAKAEGCLRQILAKVGEDVPLKVDLELAKYLDNRGSQKTAEPACPKIQGPAWRPGPLPAKPAQGRGRLERAASPRPAARSCPEGGTHPRRSQDWRRGPVFGPQCGGRLLPGRSLPPRWGATESSVKLLDIHGKWLREQLEIAAFAGMGSQFRRGPLAVAKAHEPAAVEPSVLVGGWLCLGFSTSMDTRGTALPGPARAGVLRDTGRKILVSAEEVACGALFIYEKQNFVKVLRLQYNFITSAMMALATGIGC